jgi:hypothetical protein
MLFSSRLFGRGGASRRARNCRYAFALTVRRVRSSKASSAARRAASSTKSVRFFPVSRAARSINARTCGWMRMLSASRLAGWRGGRDIYTPAYQIVMTLSLLSMPGNVSV